MTITKAKPVFNETYFIGDTGFSAADDWIGWGIQYGSRFEDAPGFPIVNHAFTVVGEDSIVEAQLEAGVVRTTLASRCLDPNQKVYIRHPLLWTPDVGAQISVKALQTVGFKYNDLLIAEDALSDTLVGHAINEMFNNWPHDELDKLIEALTPGQVICSFDVAIALASTGLYKGCPILNAPQSVDPQLLFVRGPYEPNINDISFAPSTTAP